MAKKTSHDESEKLFIDPSGQRRMFGKSLQQEIQDGSSASSECLGQTFPDTQTMKRHFAAELLRRIADPSFRRTTVLPLATDNAIARMSDPPFYTCTPNPFTVEFLASLRRDDKHKDGDYHREPITSDVSEGKADPIYSAHAYHTKVPHKAIMRYILHYTNPGDLVLDGFCGTGMTGVAAVLCGSRSEVESLGLTVDKSGKITASDSTSAAHLGARRAFLNDLAPIATFIAYNYSSPCDVDAFVDEAKRILKEIWAEIGWMYETNHKGSRSKGRIEYTVWSEVFACGECSGEIIFFKEAFDRDAQEVRDEFKCPHCKARVTKDDLELLYDSFKDRATGDILRRPRRMPVLIKYKHDGALHEKVPDAEDIKILQRIGEMPLPSTVPTTKVPEMQMAKVGRMKPTAVTHLHLFFTPRAAQALGILWDKCSRIADVRLKNALLFFCEQAIWTSSVLNRYRPSGYSQVNQYLAGVFYVPSQHAEPSPWYALEGKLKRLPKALDVLWRDHPEVMVSTGDCANLPLADGSVDYVFTDPPFGENIYYSDLNLLIEAWHGVTTNPKPEAIVDKCREKTLADYQRLMAACFAEYFRVLKPGRWMTVEFHNSKNSVWNAIQESLQHVGFVVADVRTLDKQQGSFQQVVSGGAVKQDLVISAYKPTVELERKFKIEAGTEDGVWDFVRSHLKQLPIFVAKGGDGEPVAERQAYLLFDRMVAFHVQRGVSVPMSSSEFYGGLQQRFVEREAMYFLSEQAAEFDRQRMGVSKLRQLQLFVTDESSAIQWVRQQLTEKPQSFKELQPQFMKEVAGWEKHEQPLELLEILRQNFICYDGSGQVPNPIHAYLSSNFKELRNLAKSDAGLREKATERWYVPDPNKAGDLEKLRERTLLAEFEQYKASKQRSLKVFRTEAVRAGFKTAYDRQDYKTIVEVAAKLPETVLQEDEKLLMYFDVATMRLGDVDKDKLFQ